MLHSGVNRFMPRYTHKELIIFFFGKNPKKRGTTGSARDIPVQRRDPVHAALVQLYISSELN